MAKIVIWLGPAVETWDPLTALATGIGGSETAAIHMSNELAALGHEVVVYADILKVERILAPDGFKLADLDRGKRGCLIDKLVEWFPYRMWRPGTVCDLFISSRQPEARRKLAPKCKQAWLWMHDLHCGPDWDNVIGTDYDKILCLSKWSRERFLHYYPGVDSTKVVQTSNGVDPTRFVGTVVDEDGEEDRRPGRQHIPFLRDGLLCARPLRVTWSSSPDRGLDRLLDMWPAIRSTLDSDATLHVYYGFDTWKNLAELHGMVGDLHRIALLEERLAAMATQGIVFHGRRGQQEIADSYLRSQLWLYPTSFEEVSCITAMEAQAAGCKIVATRCGALPETAPGAWFVDGPVFEADFLKAVREALIDDSVVCHTPPTWRQVAQQWNDWLS
jgi:glycosyltransferase involved in cell wall biosynthesis